MSAPAPPIRPSSITRQALLSAFLLVLIIVVLVLVARLGFEAQSSVRAYVAGEGHWSKAQKDAVYHLVRYLYGQDPAEFAEFRANLEVTLGDREARIQLLAPEPDYARVRDGFLRGRNHPEDVKGMGRFLRRYRHVGFVAEAIALWTTADSTVADLLALGDTIRADVEGGRLTPALRAAHLARVDMLATELTRLENAFSGAMGAGARWSTGVLLGVLIGVGALLLALAGIALAAVTHRLHRFEESLEREEARYRALVDGAPFGIVRTSLHGDIISANPALVRMLGFETVEELKRGVVTPDLFRDPAERERLFIGPAARGEPIKDAEFEVRRRDGTTILLRANGRALRDASGTILGFETFIEDITSQRALESQLRQAQKMEAIGQLTGGIAHDFNNLLTIILSTTRLLEESLPAEAEAARADLADVRRAAERGAEMIRKLLAFSRAEQLHFEVHALPRLLEDAGKMLRRMLPATIRLEVVTDTPASPVRTDPALFEQMVLNLATNARDAMPGGGTLMLAVGSATIDEAFRSQRGWGRPGEYTTLMVQDSGSGMPPEVLDALFVPFFTTKPPGQGTGLGLPMVYGLMKQHGGFVDVASAPGLGATVTLYFPVADADPAPPIQAPAPAPPTTGTLLLVEDEPALRRAAQRILERSGFEVLAAADGEAALELFRANESRIQLVVSDVVMPKLSGPALYATLRAQGKQIPFLFMSGYPARDVHEAAPLPDGVPLLQKPWQADQLVAWIREAMGTSPPGAGPRRAATE